MSVIMPSILCEQPVILASASPRRRELLASVEADFEVIPSPVDESAIDVSGLNPEELVQKLAREKALGVASEDINKPVIGADTVVVVDNMVLGKPRNEAHAAEMLQKLQGRSHRVVSGIAVVYQGAVASRAVSTTVHFSAMTTQQIQAYIATGEPMDKAGAYAIQGLGSLYISGIEGCYFNVVGLSLFALRALLSELDA